MASRTDLEVHIRRWDFKLREKGMRHICVIMLAGMNQALTHLMPPVKGVNHRRSFHKIRPRAYHVQDMHGFVVYPVKID